MVVVYIMPHWHANYMIALYLQAWPLFGGFVLFVCINHTPGFQIKNMLRQLLSVLLKNVRNNIACF